MKRSSGVCLVGVVWTALVVPATAGLFLTPLVDSVMVREDCSRFAKLRGFVHRGESLAVVAQDGDCFTIRSRDGTTGVVPGAFLRSPKELTYLDTLMHFLDLMVQRVDTGRSFTIREAGPAGGLGVAELGLILIPLGSSTDSAQTRYMSRSCITNSMYRTFLDELHVEKDDYRLFALWRQTEFPRLLSAAPAGEPCSTTAWRDNAIPPGQDSCAVTYVSPMESAAFAAWLDARMPEGVAARLPTRQDWHAYAAVSIASPRDTAHPAHANTSCTACNGATLGEYLWPEKAGHVAPLAVARSWSEGLYIAPAGRGDAEQPVPEGTMGYMHSTHRWDSAESFRVVLVVSR